MYFTSREKKILELLIEYQKGITVEELMRILNVSKRTVYREIASIEAALAKNQLQITKPRGKGYRLIGESFQIESLKKKLLQNPELDFDMEQRQHALALTLLLADEEITMEALAYRFEVSIGTINADLHAIEMSFPEYGLTIERRKTRGIIIVGSEKERRQISGSLIYGNVNEYNFFQYLRHVENHLAYSENFFLNLIQPSSFQWANQAIMCEFKEEFLNVTDNQLQQLIIILALSLDRILSGKVINTPIIAKNIDAEALKLSHRMLGYLEANLQKNINMNERHYFARQLEGLNYKLPQNIFIENFDAEISYKIKELIRLTANETGFDFRKDETLYEDVTAHISAALKRPVSLVQKVDNPLLDKMIEEYQLLYDGVRKSFREVFPDKEVSREELAYIVIHFASSLERNPSNRNIKALVLCSSGIGTAKILESRLLKYLPEINVIQIEKISQMREIRFEQYDLILSTIFLPGFQYPYRVISPLLLEEEIKEIRSYINQTLTYKIPEAAIQPNDMKADEKFEDVYQTMKVANDLLKKFDLKTIKSEETLEKTLLTIVKDLEGSIVENASKVTELVVQRYLVAPIGIPDSQIALFHSTNEWVLEPYFAVFELDETFPILGMDGKSMELKRILLMLAPEPLTPENQMLLGKISSSLIESDLNTEIYKEGTKKLIYQLLSSLFVQEVRNIK